ncbi:MAG: ABC transporter permease subunit [Candidimonas sp.]|nr:MAG: ABC transporter permease subunit [Candidimonas sp.]TAM27267.1 MAG: ABC transporter permease subunit [Candidimonas sp.]
MAAMSIDRPMDTAVAVTEVDRAAVNASIAKFSGSNNDYYIRAFRKIYNSTGKLPTTFNAWAAILGPLWAASRGVWGMFWAFLVLETIAWVQIGRGWWGSPGAKFLHRALIQRARAQSFLEQATALHKAGQDPTQLETIASNLGKVADQSMLLAHHAQAGALTILLTGLVLLSCLKLLQGLYANPIYERQYSNWRVCPTKVESGRKIINVLFGLILIAAIAPLTIFKFTTAGPTADVLSNVLTNFPAKQISAALFGHPNVTIFSSSAEWLDARINAAALAWASFFDSITYGINSILIALSTALQGTPWPVVMLTVCITAWRLAGVRVAIFTAAGLSYLALFGYWEISMETIALVGAAALVCVVVGIPLGIWFGKSRRAFSVATPILDLMQTLPAFVYLIPIIAFFGTGNPPGILATIIFGMPPVIRLTALGIQGVSGDVKEAAVAFGASRRRLLMDVEIPLALQSIMTGVNQTILMCLSMVVIVSLIGGGGLGKVILDALQFAAKGQGILGGIAILFCAMILDRIVQGAVLRKKRAN